MGRPLARMESNEDYILLLLANRRVRSRSEDRYVMGANNIRRDHRKVGIYVPSGLMLPRIESKGEGLILPQ